MELDGLNSGFFRSFFFKKTLNIFFNPEKTFASSKISILIFPKNLIKIKGFFPASKLNFANRKVYLANLRERWS